MVCYDSIVSLKRHTKYNLIIIQGIEMKIKKTIQKITKQEGKHSLVAKTIFKYRNSKQFHYLIDISEG